MLDAVSMLHSDGGRGAADARPARGVYGGGNTAMDAARTAKRLGAEDAIVVYRRTRERMPAHDFEVEEAEEEGVLMRWLSTIKQADEGKLLIERMELDETGFPQPTGEIEELEADSLVLALGQETRPRRCSRALPGIEVEDGVVQVGAEPDDRPPGGLRGRRHGARRALGDGRRSATARRPPATSTRGCAASAYEPPPKHELADVRACSTPGTTPTRRATEQPRLEVVRRQSDLRGGRPGARRVERPVRGAPLHVVRQLLLLRQLLRRLPRQRGAQARRPPGERYEIDYDFCKGCGICVAECPCGAIEMVPEEI